MKDSIYEVIAMSVIVAVGLGGYGFGKLLTILF